MATTRDNVQTRDVINRTCGQALEVTQSLGDHSCDSEGVRPSAALSRVALDLRSNQERQVWIEKARIDALLGCCRRSLPSVRSGIRNYFAFVGKF